MKPLQKFAYGMLAFLFFNHVQGQILTDGSRQLFFHDFDGRVVFFSDSTNGKVISLSNHSAQRNLNNTADSKRIDMPKSYDTIFLSFSLHPTFFVLYSDSGIYSMFEFYWTSVTDGYMLVNPATYILCASHTRYEVNSDTVREHIVVHENIHVNGTAYLQVDSAAANRVWYNPVSEYGESLYSLSGLVYDHLTVAIPVKDGFSGFSYDLFHNTQFYVSNVSPAIKILTGNRLTDLYDKNQVYLFEYPLQHGLTDSIWVGNHPDSICRANVSVQFENIPPEDVYFGIANGNKYISQEGYPTFFGVAGLSNLGMTPFWNGTVNLCMQADTMVGLFTLLTYWQGNSSYVYPKLTSDIIDELNDSVAFYFTLKPFPGAITIGEGDTVVFSRGYKCYFSTWINNFYGDVSVTGINDVGCGYSETVYPPEEQLYRFLWNHDGVLLDWGNGTNIQYYPSSAGIFETLLIDSTYNLEGIPGFYSVRSRFDLTKYNPNPPALAMFRITDAYNRSVWKIESGETAKVKFIAGSFLWQNLYNAGLYFESIPLLEDSVRLYVRKAGSGVWEEVPHTWAGEDPNVGSLYVADITYLTGAVDSTALSFRIDLMDVYLNRSSSIIDPAVIIGNYMVSAPVFYQKFRPLRIEFFPNPANGIARILFPEPVTGQVEIRDINGRIVHVCNVCHSCSIEVDITNFRPGLYVVTMVNQSKAFHGKLIVY